MWQRKLRKRSVAPAYDVIEYVYNPSNRLLEEVTGDTGTVYDYDLNGNVIGKSIANRNEKGSTDYHEGWVGYFGTPMIMQYEPGNCKADSLTLTLSFAHHPSQWVFMPQKVTVSYSKNGKKFSKPEEVTLPFDPVLEANSKPRVCILRHIIPNKNVKYIRIEAEPVEKLPEWHAAAGEKAWIMTDEIKIDVRR